jgi:hypothetical protein
MRDIVIGSITNYRFEDIKPYINSLDRCGFDGLKVMVCFNIGIDVIEELVKRGYSILTFAEKDGMFVYNEGKPFNVVIASILPLFIFTFIFSILLSYF